MVDQTAAPMVAPMAVPMAGRMAAQTALTTAVYWAGTSVVQWVAAMDVHSDLRMAALMAEPRAVTTVALEVVAMAL